jgi:hypothetical protein
MSLLPGAPRDLFGGFIMAVMQSVLDVIREVIATRATGWARLRDAGIQAAADRQKGESVKDAAARIDAEYKGEFSAETANERAQFRAAVLLGLVGDESVEVKPASSKAPSVNKPANMVTSWNEAQKAASDIRAMHDMATSGRKGTGARVTTNGTNSGAAPAGSMFPGVTTLDIAKPTVAAAPIGERWDMFAADLADALKDEKLRRQLFALIAQAGFQVKAKAATKEIKLPAAPVPPATLRSADLPRPVGQIAA